jgi:deoxyribodipyrimidine photo-lyase
VDRSVPEVTWAEPGEDGAAATLATFLRERLKAYAVARNDPTKAALSQLSPYLHFGQLSAQRAALAARAARTSSTAASVDAFLEELIVRRELADNYCFYNPRYDELDGLYPTFGNDSWAQRTLREHAGDAREYTYSLAQLEEGRTHEDLWNAAQLEMVHTGKMHGFMRMYWAKKILEWTASPAEALRIALHLNDKYELDGRDPNGFVGCAWAIAGVHDTAWTERPVFGKVRFMNYAGCKRKFDVPTYVARMLRLAKRG